MTSHMTLSSAALPIVHILRHSVLEGKNDILDTPIPLSLYITKVGHGGSHAINV